MTLLNPERILSQANLALKELQGSAIWKAALENASVAPPPLFVRSIAPPVERPGRPARLPDYYIVSITREKGASARFAYHAETANLLEAAGVRKAGDVFKPYVDAWAVVRERLQIDESAAIPLSDVVWMPCRESTSRFAPFWRYVVQGHPVYVRSDGMVYRALTTSGRG